MFFALIIGVLTSCGGVKQSGEISFESFIKESFSEQAIIVPNSGGNFALCYTMQKGTLLQPGNQLEYVIVDVSDRKILFREQKFNAAVEWFNADYIKVKSSPEVQSKSEDVNRQMKLYYVNVKTLKKTTDQPK